MVIISVYVQPLPIFLILNILLKFLLIYFLEVYRKLL